MAQRCPFRYQLPSLTLLQPLDYVVAPNFASLWQKHVAWAKPNGANLKQYITGHYASIMILLSLLLSASISVFFSNSPELVQMRAILAQQTQLEHHFLTNLKFWTGLLILLGIFVTLLGLVTTFTLWSMISAISNANAHCVVRCTLGQYAISLPPRLVVASLYIFLLWMVLMVMELVAHPISWMIVAAVLSFFLAAVILPLSALGRLILHTGAMAQRPILSSDLEAQLLPSGLYSSLLLRATHRQRRNPYNVTRQYQPPPMVEVNDGGDDDDGEDSNDNQNEQQATLHLSKSISPRTRPSESSQRGLEESYNNIHNSNDNDDGMRPRQSAHKRRASEFPLPHAAVLNAAISGPELFSLMEEATATFQLDFSNEAPINVVQGGDTTHGNLGNDTHNQQVVSGEAPLDEPSSLPHLGSADENDEEISNDNNNNYNNYPARHHHRHHRRASSVVLLNEWTEDVNVRDMYGAAMPANLPPAAVLPSPQAVNGRNQDHDVYRHARSPSLLLRESFRWWGNNTSRGDLLEDNDGNGGEVPNTAVHRQDRNELRDPLLARNDGDGNDSGV